MRSEDSSRERSSEGDGVVPLGTRMDMLSSVTEAG